MLPLLLLALPVQAQPWAPEAARTAGRMAIAASNAGRWPEAESFAAVADPLARKLSLWIRLSNRAAPATGAELAAFIDENPDWPAPDTLIRRAEDAIAGGLLQDADLLRLYARNSPRSLGAALALAEALGRADRAAAIPAMIDRAWAETPGDAFAEEAVAMRHAASITPASAWRRFDRLSFARDMAAAQRAAQRLTGAARLRADARLSGGAGDIGGVLLQARALRQSDRDLEAAAAWQAGESLQRDLGYEASRAVWTERQVLARKLLRLGHVREAYRTASQHGQAEAGEPRQEAEFLAGFIALRRMNDPAAASRHFARLGEGSRSVITRARAGYWQGRAAAARGDAAGARPFYEAAASLPAAFYGQLAVLALGEDSARLSARIAAAPAPALTAERALDFAGRELSRAVVTLADLGEQRRARAFLLRLENLASDDVDRRLAARLGHAIGRPDHAIWVARRAGTDGVMLIEDGWPAPVRPDVATPELPILFAITRQESNFDTEAVSGANARGLMQLLPSTAAMTARRLGIPHALPMLTGDPAHNMRLGAAYIEQMLARYGGALPLAAAAYNAGPGRVDEWLGTYGDPRATVDVIDWIEQIPFSETRNYVMRVIENVLIYRAREPALAGAPHPLAEFLVRAP
ncbi:lytic transglycosylase domain-containing protein [Plastoroseomonas arctica]|uniref:lytic transglycosylase domain-containing protein n=1 Tax=Plastoroseomonas arctica TaxID=1509237 RepID=UPI001FE29C16|nr:lytic transglycosylase domain-containing protein [Plastoroseomonas arctica]